MVDHRKLPEFVIDLEAPDEFLKHRVKQLPPEQTAGTHYTEEGMTRRLAHYRKANPPGEEGNLVSFFKENGVDILKLEVDKMSDQEIENSINAFLEKVFDKIS